MRLLIFLLLCGVFLGPYAYVIWPKLHFIRFLPPLILIVLAFGPLKTSKDGIILLTFFSIYFFYTLFISSFTFNLSKVNEYVNFTVLFFLVVTILMLMENARRAFYPTLNFFLVGFVVISFCVCLYEIITLRHLHLSSMYLTPSHKRYYHVPTTFFTNSNDFAAVFFLSVTYLLVLLRYKNPKYKPILVWGLIAMSLIVIYFTEARIILLTFISFLIVYLRAWRVKYVLFFVFVLALSAGLSEDFRKSVRNRLQFTEHEEGSSYYRRLSLYTYGLSSVKQNAGLGLGLGNTFDYYTSVEARRKHQYPDDVNPHNYLIEMLINSGAYIVALYLLIVVFFLVKMIKTRANVNIIALFILYHFVLLASSSSIYLWPHYVFLLVYINFQKSEITEEHS